MFWKEFDCQESVPAFVLTRVPWSADEMINASTRGNLNQTVEVDTTRIERPGRGPEVFSEFMWPD